MPQLQPILPLTSLRAQRLFLYALIQAVDALETIDAKLPGLLLKKLDDNIRHLARWESPQSPEQTQRMGESQTFPEQTLLSVDQEIDGIYLFLLQLHDKYTQHLASLTPEERDQAHRGRALQEAVDDILDQS